MLTRRALLSLPAALPLAAQTRPAAPTGELPAEPPLPPEKIDGPFAGAEWKLVWFHDETDSVFAIQDFLFTSATRGYAAGSLIEKGRVRQHLVYATRDGGATWTPNRARGAVVSLFALDDTHVWLVTRRDLWFSAEGGASWNKLRLPKGMARVCFLDHQNGWAYGAGKVFWRTTDGGKSWRKVPESESLTLNNAHTAFLWMQFANARVGVIAGHSQRPRETEEYLPDWMLPERAARRRVTPSTTAILTTLDGGQTWTPSVTSAFGAATRFRISGMRAASLFYYGEGFSWPSEVLGIDLKSGASEPVFRRRGIRVTDLDLAGDRGYLLAAIQPPGRLTSAGLPGKLRVLYSPDGEAWYDMRVDYRAEGVHALLAGAGGRYWAATGDGMILRLEA